jgi:hypothetical protein
MSHNTTKKGQDLDEVIKKLCMKKKEVEHIINCTSNAENISLSDGPGYCSSYYGTISIKDFYR